MREAEVEGEGAGEGSWGIACLIPLGPHRRSIPDELSQGGGRSGAAATTDPSTYDPSEIEESKRNDWLQHRLSRHTRRHVSVSREQLAAAVTAPTGRRISNAIFARLASESSSENDVDVAQRDNQRASGSGLHPNERRDQHLAVDLAGHQAPAARDDCPGEADDGPTRGRHGGVQANSYASGARAGP